MSQSVAFLSGARLNVAARPVTRIGRARTPLIQANTQWQLAIDRKWCETNQKCQQVPDILSMTDFLESQKKCTVSTDSSGGACPGLLR